jgi:hypothetical protein
MKNSWPPDALRTDMFADLIDRTGAPGGFQSEEGTVNG